MQLKDSLLRSVTDTNVKHTPGPQPGFKVLGGKIHFQGGKIMFLLYVLKKILGTTKFWGHKKILGGHCSRIPPRGYGPDTRIFRTAAHYTKSLRILISSVSKCESMKTGREVETKFGFGTIEHWFMKTWTCLKRIFDKLKKRCASATDRDIFRRISFVFHCVALKRLK